MVHKHQIIKSETWSIIAAKMHIYVFFYVMQVFALWAKAKLNKNKVH